MHFLLRVPYAAAGLAVRAAAEFAPAGTGKLRTSLRARRGIRARFAAWGATGRDATRPLVWVHAPSVGEGLQARPVIARLRERRPELQIAYTFFSPSAERFARTVNADFCDYLPFDTAADAGAAIAALRPAALVFSKLDVWPVLAEIAAARGTPLGLISATLAAESGRRSKIGALLLRDAYGALDAIGAISGDDAGRLVALGAHGDRISITGDARYDEAWARAQAASTRHALLAPLESERPTLVAGSTWPADEAPLFAAWRTVLERTPDARLVIAPHEPAPAHLDPILRWASASGLRCATLDSSAASTTDIVLVNRVGVLGDLYALADVAYVGGGFHSAGLHSVIEPAAFGVPVIFGPRHTASRDAGLLLECGGGFSAATASEIAARTIAMFADSGARDAAGKQARELVENGRGAADRSAALVEGLLR
ncbi:MAG: 3-deoxy-D-manno-octulosonic acid transferase [Gemmatimonadales bacterium]